MKKKLTAIVLASVLAGALLAGCVEAAEIIAFPELGCEAVRRMRIKAMPLYVGIDTRGVSIFE